MPNKHLYRHLKIFAASALLLFTLSTRAAGQTSCGFSKERLTFRGETELEQAKCLLRPVLIGGELGPAPATLPEPLERLIGRPVTVTREAIQRYLHSKGWGPVEVGGELGAALSRARDNASDAPTARYFVIHDTSINLCEAPSFPGNINEASWRWNKREAWADSGQAHLYLTRDGSSIQPRSRTFATPWRATALEGPSADTRAKGLFLHIENVQPRRCDPDLRQPAGLRPDRRYYRWDARERKWKCRNDRISPGPGFTVAQLDRLALVYVAASVRRGRWMVPAFHAAVDAGISGAHDDPQNFNLAQWAGRLCALLQALGTQCQP